ncbi:MAG: tRNA glutamyl-Q(34) synthetase GluQRS [Oscillospiraceae bacterium]|nr:tRNA glutamyl-Q(34) synthetase GluQRS [Oscillospiraceae bacterium]
MIGRFAPSPSGRMHLGNLFSALLAWLSVRSQHGEMILRIEDLDPDRCRREYAETLKEDLLWLGLDWDREQLPQSRRTAAYEEVFEALRAKELVYPCYCTRAELHAASAPHASDGQVIYAGTCRHLTDAQKQEKTKAPAWRLAVPDREISFRDGLQGLYTENLLADCGDFIVRRADGVYAYQLAVVTDDADGAVTQVVRGMDLLSSTPRQLYLYELMGKPAPEFYHVPLLVASDGRRLSKREKDLDMGALRKTHTPEALVGYLACLAGLLEKPEAVSAKELAQSFDWNKVRHDPVVVSMDN